MNAFRQPKTKFTEEEYFRFEEGSPIKHEFFAGELFPMREDLEVSPGHFVLMAGASQRHNDLVSEALLSLGTQLRDTSCAPRVSAQRIRVEATGLLTYPDLVVACSPLQSMVDMPDTLTDATVIIEVLSPSTSATTGVLNLTITANCPRSGITC